MLTEEKHVYINISTLLHLIPSVFAWSYMRGSISAGDFAGRIQPHSPWCSDGGWEPLGLGTYDWVWLRWHDISIVFHNQPIYVWHYLIWSMLIAFWLWIQSWDVHRFVKVSDSEDFHITNFFTSLGVVSATFWRHGCRGLMASDGSWHSW